jgi:hypothetical protein
MKLACYWWKVNAIDDNERNSDTHNFFAAR